jgi:N-acetylglucosamine-6-sulfatase
VSRPRVAGLLVVTATALVLAGVGLRDVGQARVDGGLLTSGTSSSTGTTTSSPAAGRPNVVVILADDLDKTLMPYMPHVQALLRDAGAELTNFYVEQSTCCTSRATLLSGRYAHNHGVIANTWPEGGFARWQMTGEPHALPVWLRSVGYRNALLGKYFNEYPFPPSKVRDWRARGELRHYMPPGWNNWWSPVRGNAYTQEHYKLNVNHSVDREYREEFLDQVLGRTAVSLVGGDFRYDFDRGGQFLYYASYSPHAPYPSPDEYADDFADVRYPRTPDFDEGDVSDKFGVTRLRKPLTAAYVREIDEAFRDRIRSVQVLDRNVADLVEALDEQDALDDTYIVFTSDNGYIMGGHRREIGKYNHFQATVNVPFYVRGPGIAPGTRVTDPAGNVDIAPTIADMADAPTPADVDGLSLLPRLTGGPRLTRKYLLLGRDLIPTNRKATSPLEETPEKFVLDARASRLNDFVGLVSKRFKLIRYTHLRHEELYDLERDPYELRNLLSQDDASYAAMSPEGRKIVRGLRDALDALVHCDGADCRI